MLMMLPWQARWIESVVPAGMARWNGWLDKEKSVTGGGTKAFIAEIGWRWLVEVESFVDEMD